MNIGVTTWIEYGIAFIVSILIVNRLVDAYFAKYVTKSAIKDESEEQVEEIKEVDVVPHIPPPPQLYEVYTPAIFSKQRTKELYRYLTFSSRYFFDEPWLGTLAEILTLLELAINESVIKYDGKSMSIVIGTLGTVDAKSAEVFNAFNLYELTFATAEFLVKYYEETENFREIVLSILLLYVDHIEQIRHWSNDHENVLQSLAEYLSRNLPLENREMIWQFIYDIHNLAEGNDMIEDIQYQISVIQYNLDLVTKLVGDNQDFYPWSKKWLTQKIQKQSFTMDQIRLF